MYFAYPSEEFQFHKGTIRTTIGLLYKDALYISIP